MLYRIWPKDSSARLLPWTRDFISCFGWHSYLREIVWDVLIVYRLVNWRCWFGHDLGPEQETHEDYYLVESWRYCQRPRCEYCVEVIG